MQPIQRLLTVLAATLGAILSPHLADAQPTSEADPAQAPASPSSEAQAPDPRFASPRDAAFAFLEAAETRADRSASAEARARAARTIARLLGLEDAPPEVVDDTTALMLEVLDRLGRVERHLLPDVDDVQDRDLREFSLFPLRGLLEWEQRQRQNEISALAPDAAIVLVRGEGGEWRFSRETVEGIESFYDAVRARPKVYVGGVDTSRLSASLWIERQLPPSLIENKPLGIKAWKWLGLLLLIFLGFVLDLCTRALLRAIWARIARRRRGSVDDRTLSRAVKPFGLVAGAGVVLLGLPLLGMPEGPLVILLVAARAVMTFGAVLAAYRVADLVSEFFEHKARATSTKIDDVLIPLVRKSAKVFITAIGLVYLANAFSIEILPLLTGLGIGGLAVAFAAKDTIENFFGSVAVILDRPFDVGDWVVMGDVEGTVEELGFRSTRVRTFYNSLVTVPNASLVRANVDNYGRRKYRRVKMHLSITYDTPPDTIEAFCEGIRELVRAHPYTRKDYFQVWLHQMGPSSLDILLYVFHEAPDWQTELRERQRLLLDILRLARRMGVSFAFPTQTLYVRSEEWAEPEGPAAPGEAAAHGRGRQEAQSVIEPAPWRRERPGPYRFDTPAPAPRPDGTQVESRTGGDA